MVTATDPAARLEALLSAAESRIDRAFSSIIASVKDQQSLTEIADLIASGRVQEAITRVGAEMGGRLSSTTAKMFQISADRMSAFFIEGMQVNVDFDITNVRAVRFLRQEKLRLIQEITSSQISAIRSSLVSGTEAGLGPIDQARNFRSVIGLTKKQDAVVRNFESLLREGSSKDLSRMLRDNRFKLRDHRFDRSIERALRSGEPLTNEQIELMTRRYRERFVKHRAETIARTEALRAVNAGRHEMIQQAVEAGKIDPAKITQQWFTRLDDRERASHAFMNEQKRGFGQAFTSGAGFALMFPGDPLAPASETVMCRCAVTTRVSGV
jgi:hypothetical protein